MGGACARARARLSPLLAGKQDRSRGTKCFFGCTDMHWLARMQRPQDELQSRVWTLKVHVWLPSNTLHATIRGGDCVRGT